MMNPAEIIPGFLFYSYLSKTRKEKVGFFEHSTLVLQVSGLFTLQTAEHTIKMTAGNMLLIRKNQLGELTKEPFGEKEYQTIVILLKEDLLRKIALEEQIDTVQKYSGQSNVVIPENEFLRGFFHSILPYVHHPEAAIASEIGLLKVKEAVKLLLFSMPQLKDFLFDFSEPHKMNLEKFMLNNYHFNVPVEKFAQLTGRSLAAFKRDFQKVFGAAPRHWLQERRLTEAKRLIEKKKKPTEIYLELGFESLSHFSHAYKKKFGNAPTAQP